MINFKGKWVIVKVPEECTYQGEIISEDELGLLMQAFSYVDGRPTLQIVIPRNLLIFDSVKFFDDNAEFERELTRLLDTNFDCEDQI